jgi:hypothetical protein
VPPLADLALRAGDLLPVEVDAEVVAGVALLDAVLAGVDAGPSSRSRTRIAVVPAGLLARATRAVSSRTSVPPGDRPTSRTPQGSRRTHVPARLAPGATAVSQTPRFPTESR